MAQLERRLAQLEQELELSSRGRKGMTHIEGCMDIGVRVIGFRRQGTDRGGGGHGHVGRGEALWESERAGFEQEQVGLVPALAQVRLARHTRR